MNRGGNQNNPGVNPVVPDDVYHDDSIGSSGREHRRTVTCLFILQRTAEVRQNLQTLCRFWYPYVRLVWTGGSALPAMKG